MLVVRTVHEMQEHADRSRASGRRIVLVPTMGALHEGHLTLVREAFRHGNEVVVSIFVNPSQFGPGEDFGRYPRSLEQDMARLEAIDPGIVVFAPSVEEMYRGGEGENLTWVVVERLTEHLCGPHRPGHFRGVTTIVARLFLVCKPRAAVFGLKDAQQFVIIRRMVKDLLFDVEIVGVETVREPGGLAASSRNEYLQEDQRTRAVVLSKAISAARRLVESGERDGRAVVNAMEEELEKEPYAAVQYAELVDGESLQPVATLTPGEVVVAAVAAFFGETRLIDSAFVRVS